MEVGVSIRIDRKLFLDRNVSIDRAWGFKVVILEATTRGGVHIVTGRAEDHITLLAGGHG